MPHLFMATLSTETNTFSPIPTTRQSFADYFLRETAATAEPPNLMTEALHIWRERASHLNWQITESLSAIAEPAGKTSQETYEAFKAQILRDLHAAKTVDIVLLQLHGAMISEACDDCEADLTAAIRAILPHAIIGVALDCHCHLTQALLDVADLVICFKEYPHDDAAVRAEEMFNMAQAMQAGKIKPVMRVFDCRMIALFLTKQEPMRSFMNLMKQTETQAGILSVSLAHGFPWADIADNSAKLLVIADQDAELAAQIAEDLGRTFYQLRNEIVPNYPELPEAIAHIKTQINSPSDKPIVLADMSDNSGAGAPGDATYVLEALLAEGIENFASGLYFDPAAVAATIVKGEGETVSLALGGKLEEASGKPIVVTGKIRKIAENIGQHLGAGLEPMGRVVWLELPGQIDLLINDLRVQVYHPEAFTQLGIDLSRKNFIVVKSLFHFYGPFSQIASEVIFCASPGRVNPKTQDIPFKNRAGNFWPRMADVF